MKTTKRLLGAGCCALAFAGATQAQPLPRPAAGVTIYGVMDVGVERLDHVAPNSGSLSRMPSLTASLPSRLGFRGAEDLGGGYWAQFVMETGIAPDSGSINQGGRGFGRQSFVGLTAPWGNVTFGRQYSNFYLALLDAGVLGPNAHGLSSLDPYIPAARFDNTMAYTGYFGNVTVAANYSLGRDVAPAAAGTKCAGEDPTDSQACRAWSVMAKYTTASWGVSFGADDQKGGAGAAGGLTSSGRSDRRIALNGFWRTGPLKLAGGLIRRDNEGSATQPRSNLYYVEAAYAITPAFSLEGQVSRLGYRNSPTGDSATLYAVRGVYSFSKRSAVYASFGHIKNRGAQALSVSSAQPGGTPAAGASQNGLLVGIRHTF